MGILRDTFFPPKKQYYQDGKKPDDKWKGNKRYNSPYLDEAIYLRSKLRKVEHQARQVIECLERENERLKRRERQFRR